MSEIEDREQTIRNLKQQIADYRKWLAGVICRSENEVIDAVYSICQSKFIEVFGEGGQKKTKSICVYCVLTPQGKHQPDCPTKQKKEAEK
jgi:hypothetical protein